MPDLIHQLWFGDSRDLCKKFKEGRVDAIITDPPYGTDNLSKQAATPHGKEYSRKIEGDQSPQEAVKIFKEVMEVLLPKTKENSDCYIFTSYQVLSPWLIMLDNFMPDFGYSRKAVLVWEKEGPGMGDLTIPWGASEFIMFYRKGRMEKQMKRRSNVLHHLQIHPGKLIHPHEKCLPLLEDLIKASTSEGEFIVDPFSGSGSLIRAAQRCNRSAVGIEKDEKNHELAQKALFEGKGTGFDW